MNPIHHPNLIGLYRDLQRYVGWQETDRENVIAVRPFIEPLFPQLIDDFYAETLRHEATAKVLAAGEDQIHRLKKTLLGWLNDLFAGQYDEAYVESRWRVGRRHVEIDLDQTYVTVSLGRIRLGILEQIHVQFGQSPNEQDAICRSVNKLLDVEGAFINATYQAHMVGRLNEKSELQLKQTERLATIGKMITGLAHESRNLLQRSHACLATLMLDIDSIPDAMKQATRIQAALDRLQVLYEEVRNYAAPLSLDLNRLDLNKLVLTTWQNLAEDWGPKNIRLELETEPGIDTSLDADRYRIEQVFTNLFQNAVDVSAERSTIQSRLSRNEQGELVIEIRDHGQGIPEDVLPRVFEPFFTTKPRGTGLGLAITWRIVEAHGGSIRAQNMADGGARFTIVLPTTLERTAATH